MPQVDLETLVSVCGGGGGGGDRKIACETLVDGNGEHRQEEEKEKEVEEADLQVEVPPDFPPESFWLSKDAEFDWFDRNAFYERKDSTKGSNSTNLNPSVNPISNSSSQRFSTNLKSKAAMIGLPKTQKTTFVDTTKRKPANIRLFPKRPESVGKSTSMAEPTSPKVSCMGRVRSKRCRRKQSEPAATAAVRPENARSVERRRTGISRRFMAIFRFGRRTKYAVQSNAPPPAVESPPRRSVTIKAYEISASVEPTAEPPSLGGMTRFTSGRRSSASLGADD